MFFVAVTLPDEAPGVGKQQPAAIPTPFWLPVMDGLSWMSLMRFPVTVAEPF